MLAVGEVHTGLLQHSTAMPIGQAVRLLNLVEGGYVRSSERPTPYAVSPELLTGVDCTLPSAASRKVRGVGAVLAHASVTGGRVVQASSSATVEQSASTRRLPWAHYIARPGRLEAIGRADWTDVLDGFLAGAGWHPASAAADQRLNLGAIAARLVDTVQSSERLDRRPPFRTQRTRLRWAVAIDEQWSAKGSAVFTVQSDALRTLRMALGPQDAPAVRGLCEDLALHDWLLTTLTGFVERAISSPRTAADKAASLRPIVEHLLHLWMPGARVDPVMQPVWDVIERQPGFTRQWNSSVTWIRDQLAAGTMAMLER